MIFYERNNEQNAKLVLFIWSLTKVKYFPEGRFSRCKPEIVLCRHSNSLFHFRVYCLRIFSMVNRIGIGLTMTLTLFMGCESSIENDGFYVTSTVYDFRNDSYDWEGDFSDYPVEDSIKYALKFDYVELPSNLGTGKSLMLSGNNQSDDLFMFLKKKLTGLRPTTEYSISFEVKFATNVGTGSIGAGGSPGESVYLKAGARAEEPEKIALDDYYVMNLDKGNQSSRGKDMIVIGTISSTYANDFNYVLETRNNITSFTARTNQNGELWIIVGTDSGFEGITTIYYTQISIVLSQSA